MGLLQIDTNLSLYTFLFSPRFESYIYYISVHEYVYGYCKSIRERVSIEMKPSKVTRSFEARLLRFESGLHHLLIV